MQYRDSQSGLVTDAVSQELACIIRPAGKSCDCEGCTTKRAQNAKLDPQEGTHMGQEMEVLYGMVNAVVQAISYKTAIVAPLLQFDRSEASSAYECPLLAAFALGVVGASVTMLHVKNCFYFVRSIADDSSIVVHLFRCVSGVVRSKRQVAHWPLQTTSADRVCLSSVPVLP